MAHSSPQAAEENDHPLVEGQKYALYATVPKEWLDGVGDGYPFNGSSSVS